MTTTILAIDDDEAIRMLYADLLRDAGYTVHVRANPEEASVDVATIHPELIIVSWRFGTEELGTAGLDQMVRRPGLEGIPVLICTAATDRVPEATAFSTTNVVGILAKPFLIDDLLAAVQTGLTPPASPCRHGPDVR